MHRPDNENDKVLSGCALYLASAVIVVMAIWLLYDAVADRLHW